MVKVFPIDTTLRGYTRLEGFVPRPGDVQKPGQYQHFSNMTVRDLLMQAGNPD